MCVCYTGHGILHASLEYAGSIVWTGNSWPLSGGIHHPGDHLLEDIETSQTCQRTAQ